MSYLDELLKVVAGFVDAIARRGGQVHGDFARHILDSARCLGKDIDLVSNPLLCCHRQIVVTGNESSQGSDCGPEDHPSSTGESCTKFA